MRKFLSQLFSFITHHGILDLFGTSGRTKVLPVVLDHLAAMDMAIEGDHTLELIMEEMQRQVQSSNSNLEFDSL